MTNKKYLSGRRMEYAVKHYLESKGYMCIRSAGSKSSVDVVAINDNEVLLIQCKHTKLTAGERRRIEITLLPFHGQRHVQGLVLSKEWRKEI